jgi:uncharacterized membrane protein
MNLAHLHLILNHFPTVGMVVGVGLFIIALVSRSDDLKRACLAVLFCIGLLSLPAYMTGNAAQAMIAGQEGVSETTITAHQESALLALIFMELTGVVAWIGLWQYRRQSRPANWNLPAVLVFSVLTLALMARAASIGGEIRHPEIVAEGAAPTVGGISWLQGANVGVFALSNNWVWPLSEAIHFLGLGLLFGVVLIINLRMLGLMRNVSFATLHGLLPLGIFGFAINTVTGMLFFVATPEQYIENLAFYWKVVLMMLACVNVLYHTLMEEPWSIGAGDEAPLQAKIVALSSIILWFGVIYFGRMLPFIGNSF